MKEGLERSEARRTGEWAAMSSESRWARRLRIAGMRHLDFTDAALVSSLITAPQMRWMKWGPQEGARSLRIVADVTRGFFDEMLLGRSLAGDAQCAYAEVRVVR